MISSQDKMEMIIHKTETYNFNITLPREIVDTLINIISGKDFDIKEFEVQDEHKLLPMRNLLLAIIGSYYGNEICLGSIGGSVHYDNTDEFAERASNLLPLI